MPTRKGWKEKTIKTGFSLDETLSEVCGLAPGLAAIVCYENRCARYNGGVSFRIRQFDNADFDTLWRIDQACFDPQLAYSRPELMLYMRRPGSFTLVAQAEDAEAAKNGNPSSSILGFIVAETRRKTGHIITIDVVAEARRAGVGSALLEAAEGNLHRAGAAVVALETPVNNEAAIHFYKQHGYFVEKTVAGYYSGQLDALLMTKELASWQQISP